MKKRVYIVSLFVLCFLLIISMLWYTNPQAQLQRSMQNYANLLSNDIPQDFRLTIYYMSPRIFTRAPLSVDDLKTHSETKKIVVHSDELSAHITLLKKMDASILQPNKENAYVNARIYYVFETDSNSKLLDVTINSIHGNSFVNGIAVEDNPILYDLIIPFLSEEDREILHI